MPSPFVKSLAKTSGKSEQEIEALWNKAKQITTETLGVPEDQFEDKEYAYTVGIVKQMLGVKEEVLDPTAFLTSELSAKEYVETVTTSSSFPKLSKDHVIPPKKEKPDKDKEDDKEKEEKDFYSRVLRKEELEDQDETEWERNSKVVWDDSMFK